MRPRFQFSVLIHVALLFGISSLYAEAEASRRDDAREALLEMMHAMGHLNYESTVVYVRDGKIAPLKIFHAVRDGVEQERVVALNSPLREIIRDVDKVTCFYPDTKKVVVEFTPARTSLLLTVPSDIDDLDSSYRFDLGQREHIALRPAQVINVIPRDDFRYGRRIWMDVETKLPLKFEVIGAGGIVLEQMVFTNQQIEEFLPIKSLHASVENDRLHRFEWLVHDRTVLPVAGIRFEFGVLPTGFRQVMYTQRKMRGAESPVEHILFSDGLSSLSVYIDKVQSEFELHHRPVGAINAYSRKVENFLITVMGEVPLKTVRAIGEGIVLRK